ncbi:pseudouridine synthase [Pseudoxanthomonas daejeonensis]|uniref:Pseudouridine synthase n=1 Tax=Pseudoxanthomonas daejeonensis TaxID=266062 RepID=A0ABQ6Z6A6_9GAMM|nr:pseudouridine synthase [Pseudoxanthomonas daejeonensis]KAF1693473.1 pseudouridine synthase [Pseudoxanthomonas daejeonensis]
MRPRPPSIDGLAASTLQLPPGAWPTVLDCLCDRFPAVARAQWQERMARGRVVDGDGRAVTPETPYRVGLEVHYYREVADEPVIPFDEVVLHADADLLVADKPHFLPVTPAGAHVHETLLGRLVRRTANTALVPLHRIDRDTAGLVLFSTNPRSRAHYQALFRERRIDKSYEAIAPALPDLEFPLVRSSRIVAGEPFFRMREVEGPVNSETRIDVIARGEDGWRYALMPVTGRKHQLRVHMAALGAPIANDAIYPLVRHRANGDYPAPLQLLARRLAFIDPLSGAERSFSSGFELQP